MRRRTICMAGAAAVLVLGGACVGAMALTVPQPAVAESRIATSTVAVTRGDLVDSTLYPGVLGYGSPEPLEASASGVVTSIAAFGSVVRLGGTLYTVDERPVVAFHGALPVYRTMSWGMKGGDVRQLNSSLRALGHATVPDSDEFTSETARAVSAWQKEHGHVADGIIGAEQIAFVPGDVRIAAVTAHVGSSASGPIVDYTSTRRVVTSTVSTRQASAFAVGAKVEIGLPDGSTAKATVVGQTSQVDADSSVGDAPGDSTVEVTMAPTGPATKIAGGERSVDVRVPGVTRKHVLSVPVAALVVDEKGAYEVETKSPKGTVRVHVELGLFAQGRVEISGNGITEGTKVVTPA
jgi:peptidoglycan hydrolase-like protein with peptidoglycan-binding domain